MLIVYTKPDCTWCTSLKERLNLQGIEFDEINIGTDITREEFLETFPGVRTVPYVLNDGDPIGSYEQTIEWLKENKV